MSSVGLLIARDSQNFDDVKSAYSTLLVHKQSVVIETTGRGPSTWPLSTDVYGEPNED